jgi:hypothetical protein
MAYVRSRGLFPSPLWGGVGWGSRGISEASLLAHNLPTPHLPSPTRGREFVRDAARFRHNGACDSVRRGRPGRSRAHLPRGYRGPAAPRAPRRCRPREPYRRRDPDRHRAPRRSYAPRARHLASVWPAACCCSQLPSRWCSAHACAAKDRRPKKRSRSMCAPCWPDEQRIGRKPPKADAICLIVMSALVAGIHVLS